MTKIAFIGIGLMGLPMAKNLLSEGYSVYAWNRTISKATPLQSLGATICEDAADAVRHADVIITMLENGPIVSEILLSQQVQDAYRTGQIVIDMSSIPPKMARQHSQKLAEFDVQHLDAPVSGGTKGAADATLTIMAGGNRAVFDRCIPIFKAMGRATYIGPDGCGQLAKCTNQVIVGNTIAAVAEGLLLAAAGGADPVAVREALSGGFADSRILQEHGKRMLEGNFQPGGKVTTQLKDLNTALEAVKDIDLPVT
ncbi:MAG: NAD(P)-dependent oxidoreductase, partial [Alphaproteobacteria bacterium]|nr:NAD(P)-dependent oxidoreductase [Alphaproteobacteria bacterium]